MKYYKHRGNKKYQYIRSRNRYQAQRRKAGYKIGARFCFGKRSPKKKRKRKRGGGLFFFRKRYVHLGGLQVVGIEASSDIGGLTGNDQEKSMVGFPEESVPKRILGGRPRRGIFRPVAEVGVGAAELADAGVGGTGGTSNLSAATDSSSSMSGKIVGANVIHVRTIAWYKPRSGLMPKPVETSGAIPIPKTIARFTDVILLTSELLDILFGETEDILLKNWGEIKSFYKI